MIAPPAERTRRAIPAAEARALIGEARRRHRRRRVIAGSLCLGLTAGAAIGIATAWPRGPETTQAHRPAAPSTLATPRFRLSPAAVAWVDSNGGLHIGNAATLTQRRVATINNANQVLIQAAGRIYWADGRTIWALDLVTGARHRVAAGQWAALSANGRELYVAHIHGNQANTLTIVPVTGHGASRDRTLPPGWQLANYPDVAVAGGLLVDSRAHLGIWSQRTGRVRALPGLGMQEPIGSYTPRGASYSLLAWWPGNCRSVNCPIGITNTASLATVPVHSPFRYGFLPSESGQAFSPDGTQFAVFVNLANGQADPALVNTRTGTLRLDRRVRLEITELAAWVTWLGGKQLLVGAINQNDAIDASTLASRPFYFFGQQVIGAPDISWSAAAIPASALSPRILRELRL